MSSPTPWFYSAAAYYELRKYDQAEKSIRTEIDMDPQFRNRRAQYVLGMILIARHDTAEGLRGVAQVSGEPHPTHGMWLPLAQSSAACEKTPQINLFTKSYTPPCAGRGKGVV